MGPEEWGWIGLLLLRATTRSTAATRLLVLRARRDANGGMDYMPWLLAQMRQHEQTTGNRLLDVFTLHYYPQGGEFGDDTSTAMQQRRNRSTRSLWDPNYTDETWIGDKVRLIPRMKEWVNAYYPGLETGITEYNWGADEPHQRRHRPGRRPRHLRPRGPQRRHPLDGPGDAARPRSRPSRCTATTTAASPTFGDIERQGHRPQPGQPRRLRRRALERRRRHRHGHQQGHHQRPRQPEPRQLHGRRRPPRSGSSPRPTRSSASPT